MHRDPMYGGHTTYVGSQRAWRVCENVPHMNREGGREMKEEERRF